MSEKIKPFNKPESQFTQMHNTIFDVIMPLCKPNEWQVLCAIIRRTRGWDKTSDDISYSQIQSKTGISSYSTIQKAVEGLVKKNMITTSGEAGKTKNFKLNTEFTVETTFTETVKVENDLYKNCKGDVYENCKGTFTDSVNTKDSLNKDLNKLTLNDEPDLFDQCCRIYETKKGSLVTDGRGFALMIKKFVEHGVTAEDYAAAIDAMDADPNYTGHKPTSYEKWAIGYARQRASPSAPKTNRTQQKSNREIIKEMIDNGEL